MIIFNVFNGRKRIKNAVKLDGSITTMQGTDTNETATKKNSKGSDITAKITSL